MRANVPLFNDLGSGTLADLAAYGLVHDPTVREAVAEGADIVTFSATSFWAGHRPASSWAGAISSPPSTGTPMKRALRVDKIRLAALEATLKLYLDPDRLARRLPTLRLLTRQPAEMAAVAARVRPVLAAKLGDAFAIEERACKSQIGSGALPLETLASTALALIPADGSGRRLAALADALRRLPVPVVGRVEDGALLLDLRCLEDEAGFAASLAHLEPA